MTNRLALIPVLILCFACAPKTGTEDSSNPTEKEVPTYDEKTTQAVVDHHLKAFIENDLEETMVDYTEESILITPDRVYRGLAEIRVNFENAFAVLPSDSTTVKVAENLSVKDVGYIIWEADTPTLNFSYCTDTFIVQDGKIISQTFAGIITPK